MRLTVRVHPRSAHARAALHGDCVHVWTRAPAVDDRANDEAVRILAGWLRVTPSAVVIVSGRRSRVKVVDVDGVDAIPGPSTGDAAP